MKPQAQRLVHCGILFRIDKTHTGSPFTAQCKCVSHGVVISANFRTVFMHFCFCHPAVGLLGKNMLLCTAVFPQAADN